MCYYLLFYQVVFKIHDIDTFNLFGQKKKKIFCFKLLTNPILHKLKIF